MKRTLLASACLFSLFGWTDDLGSYDAATQTLTYDLASNATETKAFTDYGAVTNIVKKGTAMLTVSPANTDFGGTIDIREGRFAAGSTSDATLMNCLGTATIVVRSGAQFRSVQKSSAAGSHYFSGCTIRAEGPGPDDTGAIYVTSSGSADQSIPATTMTGPMIIGGSSRWGFGATLDMGGFTMTNKTTSQYMWTGVNVANAGHIVHAPGNDQFFTFENRGVSGGDSHVFAIGAENSTVNFWNNGKTLNWTFRLLESGNMYASSGTGNANSWTGPVIIDEGKTLTLKQNYETTKDLSLNFTGEISGKGALRLMTNNKGRTLNVYLKHANTYSGGTEVQSRNILHAKVDQSIPATGEFNPLGGQALMYLGTSGGWTAAHAHAVYDHTACSNTSETLSFYTPSGVTFEDGITFTTSTARVVHRGPGTFVSTGGFTALNNLVNQEGTWKISGNRRDYRIKSFNAWNGNLVFEDAGYMWTSNHGWNVYSSTYCPQPRVIFKGATTMSGYHAGKINNVGVDTCMSVGGLWNMWQRGLVEIHDGAVISNKMYLGASYGTVGAAFQSGGTLYEDCKSEHDGKWGESGYGHYLITDGQMTMGDCHNVGSRAGGTGVVSIRGGAVTSEGSLFIGAGGTGVVYMTGGTFRKPSSTMRFNQLEWAENGRIPGRGILTLAGEADMMVANAIELSQRTNGAAAFINLNGGVLETSGIKRRTTLNGGKQVYGEKLANQGLGYVNFNGGTLRAYAAGSIFPTNALQNLNRVTVFKGGATIDTNGKDVKIELPLEKPEGWGVKAITIPANVAVTNYLGPQVIFICGGDANAIEALAITDFDETKLEISSVTVMSPGTGYKQGDTVRAFMKDNIYKTSSELTVELEELVGGGLVKTGAGTLTLAVSNSYAGATIVSNGTLKATVAGAIPASSAITIVAGAGTLDVTGVGLAPGQGLAVDARGLSSERPAKGARHWTLAQGLTATPTVTGALPYPWRTTYRSDGRLTADYASGTMILLR